MPTLVVHDRGDRINAFADGQAFAHAIQGAQLLATEGLGHRKMLKDPRVLARTPVFTAALTRAGRLAGPAIAPSIAPLCTRRSEMGMFDWTEKPAAVLQQGGVIAPDERLPWPQTAAMGVQHVIAMFGATVLAPILMGFDPNIAILMSGIGTLIFFVITGGKVPSYLGSSFAFIGVVIAATAYAGKGPNGNIGVALGGIIACGVVYALIGAIVHAVGTGWIERFMPPVVTGAVVAVIGLNLAGIPIKNMAASNFDGWMQAVTFVCVGLVAVLTRGMVQRLLILVGLIDRQRRLRASSPTAWAWASRSTSPASPTPPGSARRLRRAGVRRPAMLLIAPVAIILVAENLGHIKAVTAMTGRNLDQYMGRAFIGDGVATVVSGAAGGTGVTTYAENIGVMAATKIYSTAVFVFAALIAIVLGFSPKFGAVIQAIPLPVMGGVSIVVFGLIAVAGAKIWVDNRVDFSQNSNLIVAAITLVLGTGDFTLKFGGFALGGIGTATFGPALLFCALAPGAAPAPGPAPRRRRLKYGGALQETALLGRADRDPQGHRGRPPGH